MDREGVDEVRLDRHEGGQVSVTYERRGEDGHDPVDRGERRPAYGKRERGR